MNNFIMCFAIQRDRKSWN